MNGKEPAGLLLLCMIPYIIVLPDHAYLGRARTLKRNCTELADLRSCCTDRSSAASSGRYRRAGPFLNPGPSSCHSKRTKIAVITSRRSGTESLCCTDQQRAKSAPRIRIHERRTYSGRPSSSMRFSDATAMATSVVCRPSVRDSFPVGGICGGIIATTAVASRSH
jgi:hypothetical protein